MDRRLNRAGVLHNEAEISRVREMRWNVKLE